MIWRVVLDPRIPDGLAELRAAWTLDDLDTLCGPGYGLLDQLDALEMQRQREAEARARAR